MDKNGRYCTVTVQQDSYSTTIIWLWSVSTIFLLGDSLIKFWDTSSLFPPYFMVPGLADPQALPLAVATFQACQFLGVPECSVSTSVQRHSFENHSFRFTRHASWMELPSPCSTTWVTVSPTWPGHPNPTRLLQRITKRKQPSWMREGLCLVFRSTSAMLPQNLQKISVSCFVSTLHTSLFSSSRWLLSCLVVNVLIKYSFSSRLWCGLQVQPCLFRTRGTRILASWIEGCGFLFWIKDSNCSVVSVYKTVQ